MRFGFVLPNNWGLPDATSVTDLAVEAEELGFDSVWVNHHVLNVGYVADRLADRPYHDALTVLTWAAARTERVRLGTSVLVLPYLHPMTLAKSLATLDRLSEGRLVAGLGVGSLPEENAALGVPYDGRGSRSDECIEVMRALWTPGPTTHHGPNWQLDGVVASPTPAQEPLPIWIGGNGALPRRRVARLAQGWHPMCSIGGLQRRLPRLVEALAAEGRDRGDVTVAPRIGTDAVPDAEAVAAWRDAGADELIVSTVGNDLDAIRFELRRVASLMGR